MKHLALILMLGLALGVAGCTEEDDPTEAFCASFGTAATYQWTACNAGCTLANPAQAHDQSLTTTATIVPVDGQTTYTARLTATATGDIPSGAVPGVFLTQPTAANFQTMNTEMRTLNNGVQVEVLDEDNEEITLSESGTPATGFLGMRTTQAFDALELTVTVTWNAGQAPNYSVYEICNDGGNI